MSLSKQWAMGLVSLCLACAFCATANAADPTEKELNDPAWWAKQAEKSLSELPLQAKDDPYTYVMRKQDRLAVLAGVYAQLGEDAKYESTMKAAESLVSAMEEEYDREGAYYVMGISAARGGKYEDSRKMAAKCNDPAYSEDVILELALALHKQGKKDEAAKVVADSLKKVEEPDAWIVQTMARYFVLENKPEQVMTKVKPHIAKMKGKSNQAYAWSMVTRMLSDNGYADAAKLAAAQCSELLPEARKEWDAFAEEKAWEKEDAGETVIWPEDPNMTEEELALAMLGYGDQSLFTKLNKEREGNMKPGASFHARAATLLVKQGKNVEAEAHLVKAMSLVDLEEFPMDGNWDIPTVAEALAWSGKHKLADEWINNMTDSISRGSGRVGMANYMLEVAKINAEKKK